MTIPLVEHRRFRVSETTSRQRLTECSWRESCCGKTRKRRGASASSSSETVSLVEENIVPINAAALSQNHDLIRAIIKAEVSGPVMSSDEFKAWLYRQQGRSSG
jgi:hypothetical protein